jgi:hypothetical protein
LGSGAFSPFRLPVSPFFHTLKGLYPTLICLLGRRFYVGHCK